MDQDAAREYLRRGDAFAKTGDVAAAIGEYLAFATWAESAGFDLKAVAVHKQVLNLAPERRDIRRRLAEGYIALGLLDDARSELERIANEARFAGDQAAHDDALTRSASIS